ncbi:basic salivary proline-rich protein 2-like [Sciurus carolinensis]|uniref:basic salivary proline-rich protein 2-like n=1 Tax=Sciurus carolinensis TaxID=30640 RepID=UPI001FB228DB|nr:basic salivary proline-rich protein 2-like [Sciurus carolinensis]
MSSMLTLLPPRAARRASVSRGHLRRAPALVQRSRNPLAGESGRRTRGNPTEPLPGGGRGEPGPPPPPGPPWATPDPACFRLTDFAPVSAAGPHLARRRPSEVGAHCRVAAPPPRLLGNLNPSGGPGAGHRCPGRRQADPINVNLIAPPVVDPTSNHK